MGKKKSTNKYAKLVADVIEAHYPGDISLKESETNQLNVKRMAQ